MDQFFNVRTPIRKEDLFHVHFPEDLEPDCALQLMQVLVINETAFVDGASLLESTHRCALLWEESWTDPEVLSPLPRFLQKFAQCSHASLSFANRAVLAADIYEGTLFSVVWLSSLDINVVCCYHRGRLPACFHTGLGRAGRVGFGSRRTVGQIDTHCAVSISSM